jgi:hypothetical protein
MNFPSSILHQILLLLNEKLINLKNMMRMRLVIKKHRILEEISIIEAELYKAIFLA